METLPQPPAPYVFYCEREDCGHQFIDLWDMDWSSRTDPTGPLAPLCLDHAIELALPEERDRLRSLSTVHRQFRHWVGDPPGTVVAWEETIGDRGGRRAGPFPAKVFGIGVDSWDPIWPQSAGTWIKEDDWPSLLVVLGAFVTTSWDLGVAWRCLWSWQHPDWPGTCDIWPPDAQIPRGQERAFLDARGAFYEFQATRGRAPENEDVVCADFRRRLPSAITAARDALEDVGEPRYRDLRQHELAAAFGFHEDTLRNRLRKCHMSWSTVKRRSGGRALAD